MVSMAYRFAYGLVDRDDGTLDLFLLRVVDRDRVVMVALAAVADAPATAADTAASSSAMVTVCR